MKVLICPFIRSWNRQARLSVACCEASVRICESDFSLVAVDLTGGDEASSWCSSRGVRTVAANDLKGTFDWFLLGEHDGICPVPQSHLLYPSACSQLSRHLRQFPSTDFLVSLAQDRIEEKSETKVSGVPVLCHDTHNVNLGYRCGPEPNRILEDNSSCLRSVGTHVFFGRRAVSKLVTTDLHSVSIELAMLRSHQNASSVFWMSYMSDWSFKVGRDQACDMPRDMALGLLESFPSNRSSFDELPVRFPFMLMTLPQKLLFLESMLA